MSTSPGLESWQKTPTEFLCISIPVRKLVNMGECKMRMERGNLVPRGKDVSIIQMPFWCRVICLTLVQVSQRTYCFQNLEPLCSRAVFRSHRIQRHRGDVPFFPQGFHSLIYPLAPVQDLCSNTQKVKCTFPGKVILLLIINYDYQVINSAR